MMASSGFQVTRLVLLIMSLYSTSYLWSVSQENIVELPQGKVFNLTDSYLFSPCPISTDSLTLPSHD